MMGMIHQFGSGCPRKFDPAPRYATIVSAGWSSLVARWAHNPKVEGSNPSPATKRFFCLPSQGWPILESAPIAGPCL